MLRIGQWKDGSGEDELSDERTDVCLLVIQLVGFL